MEVSQLGYIHTYLITNGKQYTIGVIIVNYVRLGVQWRISGWTNCGSADFKTPL